eukprot:XP_011663050.1 PREDICTED: contactin-associated protein-like 2 [Strongylocentrotus purpuratus]
MILLPMVMMMWMLILAEGEATNPTYCQLTCKTITTSSGELIQLIPQKVSKINSSSHGNLERFGSSTLMMICKLPSCLSSPCKNQGVCSETDYSYECMCPNGVFGHSCERLPRTCAELKAHNSTGTYLIDPDGPNGNLSDPVEVECRNGVTVVSHNIPGEQQVPQGFEDEGSYRQEVEYTIPMDTIIAILINSKSCRQYIKASCYGTYMISDTRTNNIYWVSRQGIKMTNWGDAPSDVTGCLCGVDNTCHGSLRYCNCDNSYQWMTDEGFLRDLTRLPVTRLHFGDTGSEREKTNYELGFLECE